MAGKAGKEDASEAALDLSALSQTLERYGEGTPEREAYLARLREQIRAGEYHVDAEALASKLLEVAADQILPDRGSEPPSEEV